MNLGKLRGVVPAIVTPFAADGSVDYGVLEGLTDHLVKEGVHGVMATGGTGEFPHLSEQERTEVIRVIVNSAQGQVPIIAGAGACSTPDALHLANAAAEAGADAIISVPPYYFPLPDRDLAQFFTALADESPLPLFIYNNPLYTGNPLRPELLVELLQHPNVVGLKQSDSDLGQLVELLYQIRTLRKLDKTLMTGIDSQFCAALGTGGHGIFSTAAGVVPRQVVEIFDLAMAGDFKSAHIAQLRLQPLNRFLEYELGYIAPAKEALRLLGYEVGDPRPPMSRLTGHEQDRLRQALVDLELMSGSR